MRLLCTLWTGISRKFHLHFALMFQWLRYYNMVQSVGMFQKLQEFEQLQRSSGKSKKLKHDGVFSKKKTFLQLKHYILWIYLTLLSTTCVQVHQITYAIFETISHFSQHNSSVSFQLKHYIISTKVQIFRISSAQFKVHQISVIFQIKHQPFFKV